MTEHEKLVWAAGFIDGEGCITITKHKEPTKSFSYKMSLGACNSNPHTILLLKELFGGAIRQEIRVVHKTSFRWITWANTAYEALQKLLPFLINKKYEAELAIEYYLGRPKHPGGRGHSLEELERINYFFTKLREAKKFRYPSPPQFLRS